jgi:hypothetical protein
MSRTDGEEYLPKEYATEWERANQAHQLRLRGGLTWQEIADLVGFNTANECQVEVDRMLQTAAIEMSEQQKAMALQLELSRLEALQGSYWTAALNGDIKAAEYVLKVMASRARLLQFEEKDQKGGRTLIVVPTETKDYVQTLKEIAGFTEDNHG